MNNQEYEPEGVEGTNTELNMYGEALNRIEAGLNKLIEYVDETMCPACNLPYLELNDQSGKWECAYCGFHPESEEKFEQEYPLIESKSLDEKFFTMDKLLRGGGKSFLFSIYVNPTQSELANNINNGARGFISSAGDLYVEGYEDFVKEDHVGPILSQLTHNDFLQALKKVDPKLVTAYDIVFDPENKNFESGITVQRFEDSNEFYIAESFGLKGMEGREQQAEVLLDRTRDKNPNLKFFIKNVRSMPIQSPDPAFYDYNRVDTKGPVLEKKSRISSKYNSTQMKMGEKVEQEHQPTYEWLKDEISRTGKLPPAMDFFRSIVMDHLDDHSDYYTVLEKSGLAKEELG